MFSQQLRVRVLPNKIQEHGDETRLLNTGRQAWFFNYSVKMLAYISCRNLKQRTCHNYNLSILPGRPSEVGVVQ